MTAAEVDALNEAAEAVGRAAQQMALDAGGDELDGQLAYGTAWYLVDPGSWRERARLQLARLAAEAEQ